MMESRHGDSCSKEEEKWIAVGKGKETGKLQEGGDGNCRTGEREQRS